jgi:hypothetical protein
MKFQIGDTVLVRHSNEEGRVIDVINDKMVMVEVRGVKFPAYNDQLDFPYFNRFMKAKVVPDAPKPKQYIDQVPKEKKKSVPKVVDGIWLTFIPVFSSDEFGDDIVDDLKVHIVNRTEEGYKFTYTVNYLGKPDFQLVNTIQPFEDFYVHDVPFENLNDSPSFDIEWALIKPDKHRLDFYETSLKVKPKQIFNRIEELKQKGEATFSYKLFEMYPEKTVEDEPEVDLSKLSNAGFKIYSASSARRHLDPPKYEVDLHIEKLTDDHKTMDSFEKLTLQLNELDRELELAVAHHQRSMIIIHGVGTGKLRDEVHEVLKSRKDVKSFINRYHPAYGYGATEVYFK